MTARSVGAVRRMTVTPSQVEVGGHRLAVWRHVQPLLLPHADVTAIDLLGYGASDKPESLPTLPVQVDLLAELVALWDLRGVLVVGHGIGGSGGASVGRR
ncbi:MAG: alpha/beta fold hydrolase [Pseudonocardiaceae bacterium]